MSNLGNWTSHIIRLRSHPILLVLQLWFAFASSSTEALAQKRISLKSGESVELHLVYWITNCRSIVMGAPEVEILDGPPEVTLVIKEGMVLPRRQNCAKQVPGGVLIATAAQINEPKQAKLTYRIKYKTKDGNRQESVVYNVSLFP